MRKLFIIFLIISTSVFAQDYSNVFDQANTLYKNGNYQKAIEKYHQIEDSQNVSSELYYNLANSYYKTNNVASSILYYERALKLNPNNEDAISNLTFAQKLTLDRFEVLPKSLLQQINESVFQKFSYDTWAVISVVLSLSLAIFFLLYYLSGISSKKRFYFSLSLLSFILLLATVLITIQQYQHTANTIHAIVFKSEVSVKNEPVQKSDEVFLIHEGSKVLILDTVDDWKKIQLPDGKIGWMLSKDLKEI